MAEASTRLGLARECPAYLIYEYRDHILLAAKPRSTNQDRVDPSRQFYPVSALKALFNFKTIWKILSHECSTCMQHLPSDQSPRPTENQAKLIAGSGPLLRIFALLVYIQYPLLIISFISCYDDPQGLPSGYLSADLETKPLSHLPEKDRRRIARSFQAEKWHFSAPSFTDCVYRLYNKNTILPYLEEQPFGSGGYGEVFKIKVHSAHCSLNPHSYSPEVAPVQNDSGYVVLARKQIIHQHVAEFVREKANLEQIATLQHPNLVQIRTTYRHGEKFNILFPLAKTNLHKYLRETQWNAPTSPCIRQNQLWVQAIGITEGLAKISSFFDPQRSNSSQFGYHLDLKPQNILIYSGPGGSEDVFQISDFGQTKFVSTNFGDGSTVTATGGTDAYAPPEYLERCAHRNYDVWSLGIIFLELLIYAIKGSEGLTNPSIGLDKIRVSTEERTENSRFFQGREDTAKLKPQISDWIKRYVTSAISIDPADREFVQSLERLILGMLQPCVTNRISIHTVLDELRAIKASADNTASSTAHLWEDDESVLFMQDRVRYSRITPMTHTKDVKLLILENTKNRLRIWIDNQTVPLRDHRQEMQVALDFQHTNDTTDSGFKISFLSMNPSHEINLHNQALVFESINDAQSFQEKLLKQQVLLRSSLESIDICYSQHLFKSTRSKMEAWARKSSGSNSDNLAAEQAVIIPSWIELWMEGLQSPNDSGSTTPTLIEECRRSRANRQENPEQQTPLGRVVIYCKDRLLIIPFSQECRVQKQRDMSTMRSQEIKFKPMDRDQKDHWPIYSLEGAANHHPAIPMDHCVLREIERAHESKCDTVTVTFTKHESALAFYNVYDSKKKRWLNAIKGK